MLRVDADARHPEASLLVHGQAAVARQAAKGFRLIFGAPAAKVHPVLVNGSAGVVVTMDGQPFTVISFTVADGKISGIDAIADPGRVRGLTAAFGTA